MNRVRPLHLIVCIIAVAAGLWLFNPFHLYFLNDDFIHIPLSRNGVLFQRKSFRPVCDLSIALDYWLWNKKAWGYHLSNLLLHLANTLLIYVLSVQLLRQLKNGDRKEISLLSAVLFFIYPFHSESVYWIIGRSGSLGALCFLPALIFYLKRNDGRVAFPTSLLFFAAGLLTYEAVWIFPLVAAGVSVFEAKQSGFVRKEVRRLIIIIAVFVLFLITRFALFGEIAGNYEAADFKALNLKGLAMNFSRVFVRSFAPPVESVHSFVVITVIVAVAFLSLIAWAVKAKKSTILLLLICFIVALLPYLSLGIDTHGVEGERYLYLPSIFVCLLLAHVIQLARSQGIQLLLCLFFFGYSIYFLARARNNYLTASTISKATIQQLNKLQCPQHLQVDSLPQEVNGALIFRMGFPEAVAWMCDSLRAVKPEIISAKIDNTRWSRDYKVIETPQSNDTSARPQKTHFLFTDSALEVSHTYR